MTCEISEQHRDALAQVAAGNVCFDPRFYGFCGADRDAVDELVDRGLVVIDWTRDHGRHPRYPRHPVTLTAIGVVAVTVQPARATR